MKLTEQISRIKTIMGLNENDQYDYPQYPLASHTVDGREVLDNVPNTSSISASLDDYYILKGIREVNMDLFTKNPSDMFYSSSDFKRSEILAQKIKENNFISPLIVVHDKDGPYILEGGHRFVALLYLKAKSFPAMVVIDETDYTIKEMTVYRGISTNNNFKNKLNPNEGFLWVTTDKSVAADYADFNHDNKNFDIETLDIKQPSNPFIFPYKYNVEVKGSDISNNLRLIRDKKYKNKEINLDNYKVITNMIEDYLSAAGENIEPYHTKIDKPKASKILANLLSYMGYDSIQINTDRGINYGIIK